MKYYSIESACFSGKSTTIQNLAKKGISTMLEPLTQVELPDDVNLTSFPEPTRDGYARRIEGLLFAEKLRTEKIDRLRGVTGLLVGDRSPLAMIVFEDMALRYGIGPRDARKFAREYAITQLDAAVRAGSIVMPHGIVVLSLDDEAAFSERLKERGPTQIEALNQYEPSQFINDTSMRYASTILGHSAARLSITGADTPDAVADRLLGVVGCMPICMDPQPIEVLL